MLTFTPKRRSPGNDGLPFELYPHLLAHTDIRALFLDVVNEALVHGIFPLMERNHHDPAVQERRCL